MAIWVGIPFWKVRAKSECGKRKRGKIIIDAGCTTSYVLNSEVPDLNLTKFLNNVQK